MKKLDMRYIFALALLILAVAGCKDDDFDNYKIQSVDNHGKDQNMVSVAVTATSNSEFIVYAVDASSDAADMQIIPVVLTAKDPAPHDIHIKMVPAPDSLESYNEANETSYVMPGAGVGPAFTLLNDGVVTIPKGKSVGYLTINTATNDFFGDDQYAFAFKIESVQESGYTISGNHNTAIAVVIPKNQYDGVYENNITTSGWSAYGISDNTPGDYGQLELVTSGATSVGINNIAIGGGNLQPAFTTGNAAQTQFGAAVPVYVFDANNKLVSIDNPGQDGRHRAFKPNPAAPATDNVFDLSTKSVTLNYIMSQDGRPDQYIVMKLTYVGPR
jgi:hypothetical protein